MKILHVVTLFTPDGAFGGPTRVAVNQTRELLDREHDVTLAGAALGYGKALPTQFDGVPVTLFHARRVIPRTGFAGLTSPSLLSWFRKAARGADLVHIHLARDLVTLPTAAWAAISKTPYVLQPHGMVDTPSNRLASVLDVLATRTILQRAQRILCLTGREEAEIGTLTGDALRTTRLPNGVPLANAEPGHGEPEVLFLARLAARKRPGVFVQAALELTKTHPDVRFSLVGPDEGDGPEITRQLHQHGDPTSIRLEGALDPGLTLARLKKCSVYVLPAVDEPFPMSVLEAMSVGKPVIVTDTCGLAGFINETNSGLVVDDSIESLEAAIGALLGNAELRNTMGNNALAAVREHHGMAAIADRLLHVYQGATVG